MSKLSRRTLVTSAAALPALTVPSLASSSPDPIFAAIARHRRAYVEYGRVLDFDVEVELAVEKAGDEETEAALALLNVIPTTATGAVALLRYSAEVEESGAQWPGHLLEGVVERDVADACERAWQIALKRHVAGALEAMQAGESVS